MNDQDKIDLGYYNAIMAGPAPPNQMMSETEQCIFVKEQSGGLGAYAHHPITGVLGKLPDSDARVSSLKRRIAVS